MKLPIAILTWTMLAASSFAQSSTDLEPLDLSSRAAYVQSIKTRLSDTWPIASKLYTRVDPSLADRVPGREWEDADATVHACMYDTLKESNGLGALTAQDENYQKAMIYIEENQDFNITKLADEPTFTELVLPSPAYIEAADSCGLLKLNAKRMKDAGLIKLLMESRGK